MNFVCLYKYHPELPKEPLEGAGGKLEMDI